MSSVLLVDDEQSIRATLGEFLRGDGYEVEVAKDAEAAKTLLQERVFDVVVSDIVLPRISGVDLLHFIREAAPHVQVIMMTGEPTVETSTEAVRARAADYLTKPVSKNAILRSVRHAVRVKDLEEQNRQYQKELERLVEDRTAELSETNRRLKESIETLTQTQQQVVQNERLSALGQMASGISHDFNNVLMPILGFSDFLLTHHDMLGDNADLPEYLETINAAARDAREIVRRLREFYAPPSDLETTVVNLNRLIKHVLELSEPRWRSQAQAHGRPIDVECDLPEFPILEANESQLCEVFMNLVINAVDAMPEGGVLRFSGRSDTEWATIEVGDGGTGMTPETLIHCLEPFFTTKKEHGTGLGLSLCHGIIKRHGGEMEVRSEEGEGTTMTVRLPLSRPAQTQQAVDSPAKSARGADPLHVLCVDDEKMSRILIETYLSDAGHSVTHACSAEEAIGKLETERFGLVITDRAMPGIGGDEMAREVKRLQPDATVIMLTGFGNLMKAESERPEDVDELLAKPITQDELLAAVDKVMTQGNDCECVC